MVCFKMFFSEVPYQLDKKNTRIDSLAQVLTPDGDTEFFRILAGAQIGLKLITRQSFCHLATYIAHTDFEDDLALLSNALEEVQILLLG